MARQQKVGTLRQLLAARGAMRFQAEAGLANAQHQVRDAEAERTIAEDTLTHAESEWQACLATQIYPPEWLQALGARVVDRDRLASEARGHVREAEQVRGRCETALRLADASEQVAARAHSRARSAETRRRDERRMVDRPARKRIP